MDHAASLGARASTQGGEGHDTADQLAIVAAYSQWAHVQGGHAQTRSSPGHTPYDRANLSLQQAINLGCMLIMGRRTVVGVKSWGWSSKSEQKLKSTGWGD